ncbi:MAG: pyruvate dehydrogenase [Deltaproteobacteria bacterium]|nr:pyruvate dehydrogenase [Deltaproteobacteria bacterium]
MARRALALSTAMIVRANERPTEEGDPKVGGHPAAAASSLHLLAALHLFVRRGADWIASKPHASPADHALLYLLGLGRDPNTRRWFSAEEARGAMERLRQFPARGEAVYQSYHAPSDPDAHHLFPAGSVGIPPVVALYSALGHRYAAHHGHEVAEGAHFWALVGDAELREGSLWEALPEAAERGLGNLTWIVDYNRQSLDGVRFVNRAGLGGTDADRVEKAARANGWRVVQLRHGPLRREAFSRPGGDRLRALLEAGFDDAELQLLLYKKDGALSRRVFLGKAPELEGLLGALPDAEVQALLADLGGHDLPSLVETLAGCRAGGATPTLVLAHTLKGWGLGLAAAPGNHSALPDAEDYAALLAKEGLSPADPFEPFPAGSAEGDFLAARGAELRAELEGAWALAERNRTRVRRAIAESAGATLPETVGVNLKLVPQIHTQWVMGQLLAKLVRLGTPGENGARLPDDERAWAAAASFLLTLSPDVGTSTNLNPILDGKVYAPAPREDPEAAFAAHEPRRPALSPAETRRSRHLRFDITEANAVSAMGAFGKLGEALGLPFLPVLSIYDFFIKRAYDQLFYDLYWGSSFILVGTPSGVTLSAEGAQHSWKSDIQFPNLISWEPCFALEVDWILSDAIARHFSGENQGRCGVLIRCITRALRQDELLARLGRQQRFKAELPAGAALLPAGFAPHPGALDERTVAPLPAAELLATLRRDVLAGAYALVDYRGYAGYEPGENVVHLFALGGMASEALKASDALLARGIYANVFVVTSPDLLAGTLAARDGYRHMREGLGVTGDLHLRRHVEVAGSPQLATRADLILVAGRRIPIVSVADGEVGLLDNLGSLVGVRQLALGVRKPSKCGRPAEVYADQQLDAAAIVEACGQVLAETALENVLLSRELLGGEPVGGELLGGSEARSSASPRTWRDLWPE